MYERWQENDVRYEMLAVDDGILVIAAYGTSARIARTAIRSLRAEGLKAGLVRPITVSPFPERAFDELDYSRVKNVLCVEMCIPSLMVEDVERLVARRAKVQHLAAAAAT